MNKEALFVFESVAVLAVVVVLASLLKVVTGFSKSNVFENRELSMVVVVDDDDKPAN
jgi:hypothetical protein